jgi:hypothetical protein
LAQLLSCGNAGVDVLLNLIEADTRQTGAFNALYKGRLELQISAG